MSGYMFTIIDVQNITTVVVIPVCCEKYIDY